MSTGDIRVIKLQFPPANLSCAILISQPEKPKWVEENFSSPTVNELST